VRDEIRESARDMDGAEWRKAAQIFGFQYNEHSLHSEQQSLLTIVQLEIHGELSGDRLLMQKMERGEDVFKCRVTFGTPLALGLQLSRQSPVFPNKRDIQTGDKRFDDGFIVIGNDSIAVARLLDPSSRQSLLRLLDTWDHVVIDDLGMDLRRRHDLNPYQDRGVQEYLDDIVRAVEALAEARCHQERRRRGTGSGRNGLAATQMRRK
jgi:hypothetical protein